MSPEREKLKRHVLWPEPRKWDADECMFCGKQSEPVGDTLELAVEDLFRRGWRQRVSRRYQAVGLMCPECIPRRETNDYA